jgi:hypothetical protein
MEITNNIYLLTINIKFLQFIIYIYNLFAINCIFYESNHCFVKNVKGTQLYESI